MPRFGATERVLHWVHATGFFAMLATGLLLYLPSLAASIGDRPTVKAAHLGVALAWLTALALVTLTGDRPALRRTRRDLEHYLDDDVRWLRGAKVPQGRFNAGQKSHAVVQAALAALFVLSGVLLWLGERDTAFRLPGTVALHDVAMYLAVALVLGHLFLSLLWPTTRPALRGIVRGTVRADWAARHHAAWTPATAPPARRPRPAARVRVLALVVLALGAAAIVFVVDDSLSGGDPSAPGPSAAGTTGLALDPGPDVLAGQAQQAADAGRLPDAIALMGRAADKAPQRADLRAALGLLLARSGDLATAQAQLQRAVRLDPSSPDPHLVLGSVEIDAGDRAGGRREVRTYLRLAPRGQNAALARKLLRRRAGATP